MSLWCRRGDIFVRRFSLALLDSPELSLQLCLAIFTLSALTLQACNASMHCMQHAISLSQLRLSHVRVRYAHYVNLYYAKS